MQVTMKFKYSSPSTFQNLNAVILLLLFGVKKRYGDSIFLNDRFHKKYSIASTFESTPKASNFKVKSMTPIIT